MLRAWPWIAALFAVTVVGQCVPPQFGPSCGLLCTDYCQRTAAQCSLSDCGVVSCICSDHGQIDPNTGLCLCDNSFAGVDCQYHMQSDYQVACGDFQLQGHEIPEQMAYIASCNQSTGTFVCSPGAATYETQITNEYQPYQICYPPDIEPFVLHGNLPKTGFNQFVYRDSGVGLLYSLTGVAFFVYPFEFTLSHASSENPLDFIFKNTLLKSQYLQINESSPHSCNGTTDSCRDVFLTTIRSGFEPSVWRLSAAPSMVTAVTIESRAYPGWYLTMDPSSNMIVVSNNIAVVSWTFALFQGANVPAPTSQIITGGNFLDFIPGVPEFLSCFSHCLREAACFNVQWNGTSHNCTLFDSSAVFGASATGITSQHSTSNQYGIRGCMQASISAQCQPTSLGPYLLSNANAGQSPLTMQVMTADIVGGTLQMELAVASFLHRQYTLQIVDNSSQVFMFIAGTNQVVDVQAGTTVEAILQPVIADFSPDVSAMWIMITVSNNPLIVYFLLSDSFTNPLLNFTGYYLSTSASLVADPLTDVRKSLNPISSGVLSQVTWRLNLELDDSRLAIVPGIVATVPFFSSTQVSESQCFSMCRLLRHQCASASFSPYGTSYPTWSNCNLQNSANSLAGDFSSNANYKTYFRSAQLVPSGHGIYSRIGSSLLCTNDGIYTNGLPALSNMYTPSLALSSTSACALLQLNPVRMVHLVTGRTFQGTNPVFTQTAVFSSEYQTLDYLAFVQTEEIGVYFIYLLPGPVDATIPFQELPLTSYSLVMDPGPGPRNLYFRDVDSTGQSIVVPARWQVRDILSPLSGGTNAVVIESADERGMFLGIVGLQFTVVDYGTASSNEDSFDNIVWSIQTSAIAGDSTCGHSTCLKFGRLTSVQSTYLLTITSASTIECETACLGLASNNCYLSLFSVIDAYHGNCSLFTVNATWSSVSSTPYATCCAWNITEIDNFFQEDGSSGVYDVELTASRCLIPYNDVSGCDGGSYFGTFQTVATPFSNAFVVTGTNVPTSPILSVGDGTVYSASSNLPSNMIVVGGSISSPPFQLFGVDETNGNNIAAWSTTASQFVFVNQTQAMSVGYNSAFQFIPASLTVTHPSPLIPGALTPLDATDIIIQSHATDIYKCISQCMTSTVFFQCIGITFDSDASRLTCTLFQAFVADDYSLAWTSGAEAEELQQDSLLFPTIKSWVRDFNVFMFNGFFNYFRPYNGLNYNILSGGLVMNLYNPSASCCTLANWMFVHGSLPSGYFFGESSYYTANLYWLFPFTVSMGCTNGCSLGVTLSGSGIGTMNLFQLPSSGSPPMGNLAGLPLSLPDGKQMLMFSMIWRSNTTYSLSLQYQGNLPYGAGTPNVAVSSLPEPLKGAFLCFTNTVPGNADLVYTNSYTSIEPNLVLIDSIVGYSASECTWQLQPITKYTSIIP